MKFIPNTGPRNVFRIYSFGFTRIWKKWRVEKSDVFSTVALYDQCLQGKTNCKFVIAKLKPFQKLYTTGPDGTVVTSSAPTNVSRVWYPTSAYVTVMWSSSRTGWFTPRERPHDQLEQWCQIEGYICMLLILKWCI